MSKLEQFTSDALALEPLERIRLAQSLWESVEDDDLPGMTEAQWDAEIRSRLKDAPAESWKSHDDMLAVAHAKRHPGYWQERISD